MLFPCAPNNQYGERVRCYAREHWQKKNITIHEHAFTGMILGEPIFVMEEPVHMQFGKYSQYIDFHNADLLHLNDLAHEFLLASNMGGVMMINDEDVLIYQNLEYDPSRGITLFRQEALPRIVDGPIDGHELCKGDITGDAEKYIARIR